MTHPDARWSARAALGRGAALLLLYAAASVPVASAAPLDPAANAARERMQDVAREFARTTGQRLVGVGSWIAGDSYTDVLAGGRSDHDLRLVLKAASPAEAQREWMSAQSTLTRLIRKEYGADADRILKSVNLYPPSQLMAGVEDAEDALARFRKLGRVPNLGYTGAVADAPPQFAEGLYGGGSKAWIQQYEREAGRLFYASADGKTAYTGLTDLTHMSEGLPRFDLQGTSHTAVQWCDHVTEELGAGRGDKVAKYLRRLERDLTKARSLARLDIDTPWRREVQDLVAALKDPSRLPQLERRVARLVERARGEAGVLRSLGRVGDAARKVLARAIADWHAAEGLFGRLSNGFGEAVSLDRALQAVVVAIQVRETARYAGEAAYLDACYATISATAGLASLPAALLPQLVEWTLTNARDAGFEFVASTQEAWDLMAGIHSAVGREDEDARRSYTLEDLVAGIQDERKLEALVLAKATLASRRGIDGSVSERTDEAVAQAIYARCARVIVAAWRARREELTLEYLEAVDELSTTPLLLHYDPCPVEIAPGGRAEVTVRAVFDDEAFDRRLDRARKALVALCRRDVFADWHWSWSGGRELSNPAHRLVALDTAGRHPVTVTLRVSLGAKGAGCASLVRRLDLPAGIDVLVGTATTGFPVRSFDLTVDVAGPCAVSTAPPEEDGTPRGARMRVAVRQMPLDVRARRFRAEFLAESDFRGRHPAQVVVEGTFAPDMQALELLSVDYSAATRFGAPSLKTERWSLALRGVPLRTPGKRDPPTDRQFRGDLNQKPGSRFFVALEAAHYLRHEPAVAAGDARPAEPPVDLREVDPVRLEGSVTLTVRSTEAPPGVEFERMRWISLAYDVHGSVLSWLRNDGGEGRDPASRIDVEREQDWVVDRFIPVTVTGRSFEGTYSFRRDEGTLRVSGTFAPDLWRIETLRIEEVRRSRGRVPFGGIAATYEYRLTATVAGLTRIARDSAAFGAAFGPEAQVSASWTLDGSWYADEKEYVKQERQTDFRLERGSVSIGFGAESNWPADRAKP